MYCVMETIKELNLPYVLFDKYRDTTGSYIGKVMLGSTPKMLIIVSATYNIASLVAGSGDETIT